MRLDKIKNTFNDYKLELSWGQLEAVRQALESDHSDPVKDEMLAEFQWYMDRVPGPGEEEADAKGREEGQPVPTEGGEEGDFPIPMPPTEGSAQTGEAPPHPPSEMPGGPGEEEGAGAGTGEGEPVPGGNGQLGAEEPPAGPPGSEAGGEELPPDDLDSQLPAPPAE